jgi:hypothetical protein
MRWCCVRSHPTSQHQGLLKILHEPSSQLPDKKKRSCRENIITRTSIHYVWYLVLPWAKKNMVHSPIPLLSGSNAETRSDKFCVLTQGYLKVTSLILGCINRTQMEHGVGANISMSSQQTCTESQPSAHTKTNRWQPKNIPVFERMPLTLKKGSLSSLVYPYRLVGHHPKGTGDTFPGGKTVEAWSWKLAFI